MCEKAMVNLCERNRLFVLRNIVGLRVANKNLFLTKFPNKLLLSTYFWLFRNVIELAKKEIIIKW